MIIRDVMKIAYRMQAMTATDGKSPTETAVVEVGTPAEYAAAAAQAVKPPRTQASSAKSMILLECKLSFTCLPKSLA
jgi:hypothetical protein